MNKAVKISSQLFNSCVIFTRAGIEGLLGASGLRVVQVQGPRFHFSCLFISDGECAIASKLDHIQFGLPDVVRLFENHQSALPQKGLGLTVPQS